MYFINDYLVYTPNNTPQNEGANLIGDGSILAALTPLFIRPHGCPSALGANNLVLGANALNS